MKQHKNILNILFLSIIPFICSAQVTIGAGVEPQRGALLNLRNIPDTGTDNVSANKGLLLPRVSLSCINSLEPFIIDADDVQKREHTGLMVYNINTTAPFTAGVYVWHGESWRLSALPEPVELTAGSGISKSELALRLGGTLTADTEIDQNDFNFNFITGTAGSFIVNPDANALIVSGAYANAAIGTVPSTDARLTVGGNMLIADSLIVEGLSSLRQTIITDTLFIQYTTAGIDGRRILQSDADGNVSWVPLSNIPGYEATRQHIEAVVTGGTVLTRADWNSGARHIPGFSLTLEPGVWLVYFSVVIEPVDVNGNPLPATNAHVPVWARFNFHLFNGGTSYTAPESSINAGVILRRIGALEVSDQVFGTVRENIIQGQLVLEIRGTQTRTLHLTTNSRSAGGNYRLWSHDSPAGWNDNVRVRIGYSGNPMNYAVAFPL